MTIAVETATSSAVHAWTVRGRAAAERLARETAVECRADGLTVTALSVALLRF